MEGRGAKKSADVKTENFTRTEKPVLAKRVLLTYVFVQKIFVLIIFCFWVLDAGRAIHMISL